ncbi:hypothetical protein L0222_12475, partial [bacterium]|nr:hypothetical protein [bacterium]
MDIPAVSYEKVIIRKVIRRIPLPPRGKIIPKILFFSAIFVFATSFFFVLRTYRDCSSIVENHLKSQRWALPSTIYADAPFLYQGMPMRSARLVEYLERLNYQARSNSEVGVGEYNHKKDEITFRKHSLYDDGKAEPAVLIHFGRAAVERIENLDAKEELPAYELEPIPISNLFGEEWEKRTLVKYADLPKHLTQAVLAIE